MAVQFDFPIFSVAGDKDFEQEVESAVQLRNSVIELAKNLDETIQDINKAGNRLNLYINNVLKLEKPYDHNDQVFIFDRDDYARIYDMDEIEDITKEISEDCESFEEFEEKLVDNLPDTKKKYKLNKKQMERCMELIYEYDDLFIVHEYLQQNIEECGEWFDEIISMIKESLSEIKLAPVDSSLGFTMEPFEENKHELMLTLNKENGKWQFVYLRKENVEEFLETLQRLG